MAEQILLNYNRRRSFNNDLQNWIGSERGDSDAETIRLSSVVAYNVLTHKCVRKFGVGYGITDITNAVITTPRSVGGENWKYEFRDIDTDTLLGHVSDINGASVFTDGAAIGATSTGIYIKLVYIAWGGPSGPTDGDTITLTTDTDPGGLTVYLPGEIADATITMALSSTGSTYYTESDHDQTMRHGGYRHTPTGTDQLPYFHPYDAWAVLAAAFVVVHVLDSETYDFNFKDAGGTDRESISLDIASGVIQAASGESPVCTWGIGPRVSREVQAQWNNSNAIFVESTGNDGDPGTYQEPMLTLAVAIGVAGATDGVIIKDSGSYAANALALATAKTLEPLYGYVPTLLSTGVGAPAIIQVNLGVVPIIAGVVMDGNNNAPDGIDAPAANDISFELYDCEIKNTTSYVIDCVAANSFGNLVTLKRNIFHDARGVYLGGLNNDPVYVIEQNNFYNMSLFNLRMEKLAAAGSATIFTITVKNNIFAAVAGNSVHIFNNDSNGLTVNGDIDNNIFDDSTAGVYLEDAFGNFTMNALGDNNSFTDCTDGILRHAANPVAFTVNYCNFDGNTADYGAEVTSNNEINDDPEFLDTSLLKFSIGRTTDLFHASATNDNIGLLRRIVTVDQDDVTVNGIDFDGLNLAHDAIMKIGDTNRDGMILIYIDMHDFQGSNTDDYAAVATNTNIDFIRSFDSRYGYTGAREGNAFDNSLFYRNVADGLFSEYGATLNHVVIFGNNNGLYSGSNGVGTSITNSIVSGNSTLGIRATAIITPTYCCITDAVSPSVDVTDESNFTDNPLFVNTGAGTEDLNIKTVETGFVANSACKDAASDGLDVGAWDVLRSVASDAWKKYEVEFTPKVIPVSLIRKGQRVFTNAEGAIDVYAKNFKRGFDFQFSGRQPSSEELTDKFELFSAMVRKRVNAIEDLQAIFRIKFQPDSYLKTGTAVIDSSARTLTDAVAGLTEDKFRGYHLGVVFESGPDADIVGATGVVTINPDPGWDNDEHIGKFFPYDGIEYYVLDNTTDTLTLSDPDGNLVNVAGIAWSLEKYFKIETNDGTVYTVTDNDSELPDGMYDYYINFIECRVSNTGLRYTQPTFLWPRHHSKTGFSLRFEEA